MADFITGLAQSQRSHRTIPTFRYAYRVVVERRHVMAADPRALRIAQARARIINAAFDGLAGKADVHAAIDALIAAALIPAAGSPICLCGTTMVCPDIGCDRHKGPDVDLLAALDARIRAKCTPALNTGTALDAMILVGEAIRELREESAAGLADLTQCDQATDRGGEVIRCVQDAGHLGLHGSGTIVWTTPG